MPRLFKILSFALAIVILGIFAASCGSGNTKYQLVSAIADTPTGGFDITLNGSATFSGMGFQTAEPSPTSYKGISSGSDTLEVFLAGQTANPIINSALNLSSGNQYTVIMMGEYSERGTTNQFAPAVQPFTDDNTAPTSGNGKFRIINASPSAPSGSPDIYIVPPGTDINNVKATFPGLAYGQKSTYQSETAGNYSVIVTPQGNKTQYLTQNYALSSGQIYTVVLVDVPNGGALGTPILLTDLQ